MLLVFWFGARREHHLAQPNAMAMPIRRLFFDEGSQILGHSLLFGSCVSNRHAFC
jgi:hypothetical protein